MQMNDLTGQRFGKLVVLCESDEKSRLGVMWVCQCDCGNVTTVPSTKLMSGHTKSCGCLRGKTLIDETGHRYGKLTVLGRAPNQPGKTQAFWRCQCDCGNITEVIGQSLRGGKTRSCGCGKKEYFITPENLVGKKFGRLTVLRQVESKDRRVMWECECECGNITIVDGAHLKDGHTKSCGCIGRSFGETYIGEALTKANIPYKREITFPDLKDKKALRFDFGLYDSENNLFCLIEFNGEQHFRQGNNYYSDTTVEHDKMKREYCKNNNIKLFDINYNENIEKRTQEVIDWWNSLATK